MIRGVDLSSFLEMEDTHQIYYENGQPIGDILTFLKNKGISSVRLRLWVDPYSDTGTPYLGGTCSLERMVKLAHRLSVAGFSIMLDLHFSDFWTDPGKQFKPKAWEERHGQELTDTIERYVQEVLTEFRDAEVPLSFIQVGNEITGGMLWPDGALFAEGVLKPDGYHNLARLLNAAIAPIRRYSPQSKIIIHLERSGDTKMYREYFQALLAEGVDFDIVGLSYYPFYHGPFGDLIRTIRMIHSELGYPTMIVETGYVHTLEVAPGAQMVVKDYEDGYVPYPYSDEGQAEFVRDLIRVVRNEGVLGFYYWEPLWLPTPGVSWSSPDGRKYLHEENKSGGNEWSNHALFSYDGEALPAWNEIAPKEDK